MLPSSRWIKNNSSLFFGLFIFACITPVWGYFLSMRRNEREGTKGVYSNLSEMWRNTQSPAVLSSGPLVRELELKLFSRGGRHDARERAKVVRSILRRPRERRCGGWPTQAAYIYIYIHNLRESGKTELSNVRYTRGRPRRATTPQWNKFTCAARLNEPPTSFGTVRGSMPVGMSESSSREYPWKEWPRTFPRATNACLDSYLIISSTVWVHSTYVCFLVRVYANW